MKTWQLERDRLVEATMAFTESAAPRGTRNELHVQQPEAINKSINQPISKHPAAESGSAIAPVGFIDATKFEISIRDERDEIVRRVAAFRNLQIKIGQERRQYCDAVLAQTRAALGHGPAAVTKPSR